MSERLTPKQICEEYPDQWVAVTDIEFEPGSKLDIKTAVVVCGMTDNEYHQKCLEYTLGRKDYVYFRTADAGCCLGALMS